MDLGRKAKTDREHAAAREKQAHQLDSRLVGPAIKNSKPMPNAVQPGYPEGLQRANQPPVDFRRYTAPLRGVAPVWDKMEQHTKGVLSRPNGRANTREVHANEEVPRNRQ